jgi:hypothetical protein
MKRLWKRIGLITFIGVAIFGGWYGVVAYRYWNNPPKLVRNYAAELNAAVLAVPEGERAWPVYREVITKLHRTSPDATLRIHDCRHLPFTVPNREKGARFIRSQRQLLERAREATRRKALGQILSDGTSQEDVVFNARHQNDWSRPQAEQAAPRRPRENPPLLTVLLTAAAESEELFDLLVADACVAAHDGDTPRMIENLLALLRMAAQTREAPILVNDMISASRFIKALQAWGHLMYEVPELFDEPGLAMLENEARSYAAGTISVRLEGERATFEDIVQRCYADDGDGDAYFFIEGLDNGLGGQSITWWTKLLAPLATGRFPSRNQLLAEYDRIMKIAEGDLRRPLWQCTDWPYRNEVRSHQGDVRYGLITLLVSNFENCHQTFQRAIEFRDAVLAAAALVRYQKKMGRWPQQLDELMPQYLAALPLDRQTGNPLLYALGTDRPVLYTSGNVGTDDGGMPARLAPSGNYPGQLGHKPERPWHWENVNEAMPPLHGDRILWPVTSQEELDEGRRLVEESPPEEG